MRVGGNTTDWLGLISFNFITVNIFLAILIGGAIYTLWRSDTLEMFKWFNILGISTHVERWRIVAALFYSATGGRFFLVV
jgi:hypothetical protein